MSITPWDNYSDQPHLIKDKKFKAEINKKSLPYLLKTLLINLALSPLILLSFLTTIFRKKYNSFDEIFSMGISLENDTGKTKELLKELNVKNILIRFPLNKMDDINRYKEFIEDFSEYNILINLIQDRTFIEDKKLFKESLTKVFSTFTTIKEYQIGTTINRKKWGFFTTDEYLEFFQTACAVRDKKFKNISLIGSSVIDFEYHFSVRSLFNLYKLFYDKFSILLYVDRRGSPFNTQGGFDLYKKIKLLISILKLSPKTDNQIYITETNWPITNTAPYAPTSEKECVSLSDYADFMVAYYLISIASGDIKRVYWHQLIATGYGLVDSRNEILKYPAFEAFSFMSKTLTNTKIIHFDIKSNIKEFIFENSSHNIVVQYCEDGLEKGVLDIFGNSFTKGRISYSIKEK